MLLMTIDGQDVRELGPGYMPNWSRDGKQIAFSHSGVQSMDLDTKQIRSLVPNGWSAQWSPDGEQIAFTQGAALNAIHVETQQITEILSQEQSPYQQIHWNVGWSPDSQRICFRGVRKDGPNEIASVSVIDLPDLKIHYSGNRQIANYFAWSPDGKRILTSLQGENEARTFVHEFNPNLNEMPKLLKGIDMSLQSYGSSWSPDGKFLIINARPD